MGHPGIFGTTQDHPSDEDRSLGTPISRALVTKPLHSRTEGESRTHAHKEEGVAFGHPFFTPRTQTCPRSEVCMLLTESEVVLGCELHPAISNLVLRNTGCASVGVHCQSRAGAEPIEEQ